MSINIIKVSLLYSIGIALTMSVLLAKYTKADLSTWNGLVCYYRGDSLQDSSPAGNDLSAINGGPHYESVTSDSAPFASTTRNVLLLNGSARNSYHLKASVPSLPVGNSARTLMGWVRVNQVGNAGSSFSWGGPGGPYFTFELNFHYNPTPQTKIEVWGGNVETNDGVIENDYRPSFGVWRHFAITWDGTNLLAYVNGILTYQGTLNAAAQTGLTDFFIGARAAYAGSEAFYGAAAEIAVFDRALTQDEITNAVNGGTAGGGGDPHLFGFGGVYFTWQGHCDVIITKAPKLSETHPEVEIHARTRRTRQWSAIESIAFKSGKDVGEIESDQGTLIMNGNKMKSYHTETLSVTFSKLKKKNVQYEVVFNKDKVLQVRANTRTKMLFITLSGNYPQGTVGVLGSPHKPGMFARNGTDMIGQDVNQFVENWQVTADDPKLFHNDRDPQHPTKCLYKMSEIKARMRARRLKEVPVTTREEANAACNGHPAGPLRDFCVEDMVNTGDFESAADIFYG